MSIHLFTVSVCFHTIMAELQQRPHSLQSPRYLKFGPLKKKFVDPYCKGSGFESID